MKTTTRTMRTIGTMFPVATLMLLGALSSARADQSPATASTATSAAPTVQLGLAAGAYIPTSKLGVNFLVSIDGAYQLPFLSRKLGIGLGLSYSQPTTGGDISDPRVPGGALSYASTMRELMLDALLSFRLLSWSSVWSPHAGIGPAFYFLSHSVRSFEQEHTETSTQVGFLFTIGVDYRIWRGAVTAEARIPFATVGQRTTGDSNVGAISVVFGYRLRF